MIDIKIIAIYLFISSIAYRFLLFPKKLISLRGAQLFLVLIYNILLVSNILPLNQVSFFVSLFIYFVFLFYPQFDARRILNMIVASNGENDEKIKKRLKMLFILTLDFKAFRYEHGIIEYFLKIIAENTKETKIVSETPGSVNSSVIKRTVPNITYVLMIIIITMFLITNSSEPVKQQLNLIKYGGNFYELVSQGEYFRLFSSIFLHAGWIHLLMNGFALFYLGIFIERIAVTRSFYLSVFVIGGVLASLSSFILARQNSVGASGAIFALIGALFSIVWLSKGEINTELRQKILKDVVFIIVINIFMGLSIKNIDNYAHIGGLIAGASLTYILYKLKNNILFKIFDGLAILIIVYGSVFLYKNIKLSYPQNIKFTKTVTVSDVEFKVPPQWRKIKIAGEFIYQDIFFSRFILERVNQNIYLNSKYITEKSIQAELRSKVKNFSNIEIKLNNYNIRLIKFDVPAVSETEALRVGRIYFFKYRNKYFRFFVVFLKENYDEYGDIMTRFLEFNLKD